MTAQKGDILAARKRGCRPEKGAIRLENEKLYVKIWFFVSFWCSLLKSAPSTRFFSRVDDHSCQHTIMKENIVGMIGAPEILLIGGIVVLLFGAKKIPELASGIGKGLKEFRKATSETTKELNEPEKSKVGQEKTKEVNETAKD